MDSVDAYARQERAKAVREAILGFLNGRFGQVPDKVRDRLRDIWEEGPLQKLAVSAGKAESVEAFAVPLRRKARAARSARDKALSAELGQAAIQETLRARFGSVSSVTTWMIEEIKDRKTLEMLHAAASQCLGWEDFQYCLQEWKARKPKAHGTGLNDNLFSS